jgi:hypothetical protein
MGPVPRQWTHAAFLAIAVVGMAAIADKKVVVCHYPPGNPANFHTISVGEAAVTAHLNHGDELGACPSGCRLDASLCDDGDGCTVDTCDATGACHHSPVSCDDGNACTVDSCQDGACVNAPRDCSVADPCLAGFCDANGDCATAPVTGVPACEPPPDPGKDGASPAPPPDPGEDD